MAVRIVRLGSPRAPGEGLRIGTVRRPPRGVRKADYAACDWFDVWFPNLAPTPATMKIAQTADTPEAWRRFTQRYRAEMRDPDKARTVQLLAALSHHTDFSVGCYCEDENRCHRSLLRGLLADAGASVG